MLTGVPSSEIIFGSPVYERFNLLGPVIGLEKVNDRLSSRKVCKRKSIIELKSARTINLMLSAVEFQNLSYLIKTKIRIKIGLHRIIHWKQCCHCLTDLLLKKSQIIITWYCLLSFKEQYTPNLIFIKIENKRFSIIMYN